MLRKKGKINPNTTDTLIGEGTTFDGSIHSSASIRIEGQLNGDITCLGDVTIGEKGVVQSNIQARNIILAGKVSGNVTAIEKLSLLSTGQLYGNLQAKQLIIEIGGVFEGTSKMEEHEITHVQPPAEAEENKVTLQGTENSSVLKSW